MEQKNENKVICAPILIPTLCRYKHFIRCIESLKKNTWASYTEVYVALDYPKSESHWDGYNRICEYLKGDFSVFSGFHVIKREKNFGSEKNMKDLRDEICKKYDRFIRTDDDAEFSANFLEYMNKCLVKYKDDENVIGVTGYSYPVSWKVSKDSNVLMQNCIFPMWGTGFWTDKFLKIKYDIENEYLIRNFKNVVDKKAIYKLTDARFCEYVEGVLSINKNTLLSKVSDISLGMYLIFANKYIVMPTISKVRNWGFDGTGVYCQNISINSNGKHAENYDYVHQVIDEEDLFNIYPDVENNFIENKKIINKFDSRSYKILYKSRCKLLLYNIIGIKLLFKLLTYLNRIKQNKG